MSGGAAVATHREWSVVDPLICNLINATTPQRPIPLALTTDGVHALTLAAGQNG